VAAFIQRRVLFLFGMGHFPQRRRMRKHDAASTNQSHNFRYNNRRATISLLVGNYPKQCNTKS
jgi:hypothetical protein